MLGDSSGRRPRLRPQPDRGVGGQGGRARRGAAGAPAAPRPQRRQERHRRDPGGRGGRGGQPLRQGPVRHVHPLRRAPRVEAGGAGRRPVRPGWLQRGHVPGQGRRRVEPHEARGRSPPGAAGARHRVPGPDPHLVGHGDGAAGGGGGRRPHRAQRAQDRRLPLHRPRRAVGEHHRLGGADHPPAHRHRGGHAGREEPDPEPGQGPDRAAGPAAEGGAGQGGGGDVRHPPGPGGRRRAGRRRSAPTTSATTGSPTTASPATSRTTTWARCSRATSTPWSTACWPTSGPASWRPGRDGRAARRRR